MRVIQDSDDESDCVLEVDAALLKQHDASLQRQQSSNTSHQPDTEPLQGTKQRTDETQVQSQLSQNEPYSSVSLPEQPNKRRKTAPQIGIVPYSKKSRSKSPGFLFRSEQVATDSNECEWGLEGTIRVNYGLHNPAMFPEPSSTIPNATLTQQRVLQGVMAPVMSGGQSEGDGPHYQLPPEPSVPWSDMMRFTPVQQEEPSGSTNQNSSHRNLASATPAWTPRETQEPAMSQTSKQTSSDQLRQSPLGRELILHPTSPVEVMTPSSVPHFMDNTTISSHAPCALQPSAQDQVTKPSHWRNIQLVSANNSDDDSEVNGLPKEQYKPRPSRSRSLKVDTVPIDYSVKPEKAKNVPNPPKKTSTAGNVDLVTTPRKLQQICDMGFTPLSTRRVLKQNNGDITKTVDWLVSNGEDELRLANAVPKLKTSEQLNEIRTMDPNTTRAIMHSLNKYRKDNTDGMTRIAAGNTMGASAGVVAKSAHNGPRPSKPDTPSDLAKTSDHMVQVVIPRTLSKVFSSELPSFAETMNNQARRRETTVVQTNLNTTMQELIVPAIAKERKRGRGYPKKSGNIVISNNILKDVPVDVVQGQQQDQLPQIIESTWGTGGIKPALLTTVCLQHDMSLGTSEKALNGSCNSKTTSQLIPTTALIHPPVNLTTRASHSPGTTDKVPYRVGLSKRAKIAPLLRIVKK